jgi:molybdenum cofactor synthesis domain-containing protein
VTVAVLAISDRASRLEYEDRSGPEIERELRARFPGIEVSRRVVPDEQEQILAAMEACSSADFILTTGGTGISPRDVTPEATRRFCEKELPGIAEAIRAASLEETPAAMLSRATAGTRGRCIVVNFPGSVKAVRTGMRILAPVMEHALSMLRGEGHSP